MNNWKLTKEEQILVEKNLGLVKSIVKRRFSRCFSMERNDLIQTGNLGLMSAAHFFLQRKSSGKIIDCNFSTFAWPRISAYIRDVLGNRQSNKKLAIAIKNFLNISYAERGRVLNPSELSFIFNISKIELREILVENACFENLDDVLLNSSVEANIQDDRLSPLDLLILKEEHLIQIKKNVKNKIDKFRKLRRKVIITQLS